MSGTPPAETVLGSPVRRRVGLGGGAARVELADGRTVLVKQGVPTAVAAEAAGLRWLRVPDGPPVPAVLDEQPGLLVTEFVPAAEPEPAAAAELGRRLAGLHAAGAPAFGAGPRAPRPRPGSGGRRCGTCRRPTGTGLGCAGTPPTGCSPTCAGPVTPGG